MKTRTLLIIALTALLLSACNFSLADDITPPPGYVSPTPAPTLGPIYPEQAPVPSQGAAIYMEKCAPCHGNTGLGDGPQGLQLSVTVPGLAISEIAYPAIPADWFLTVKQGRIQRFMPPFSGSLQDQQIWDVLAYAFTLGTTPDQIAQGKELYTANCAECHGEDGSTIATASLSNQEFMAKRTTNDLMRAIETGTNGMPAFSTLSEDEVQAIAAYVRTLTFGQPQATSTPEPQAVEATPETEATPTTESNAEATPEAQPTETAQPTLGSVSGTFVNASGGEIPGGLSVTLHVFDHGQDPNSAPTEILTLETKLGKDGTYSFSDVDLGEGRFFYSEVTYNDIPYESEVVVSDSTMSEVNLGEASLYDTTTELSNITLDQFHIFFNFSEDKVLTVYEIFIMSNKSTATVAIDSDMQSIPFVLLPENASGFGIDGGDGPFIGTETGFAMPPSETQYQLQVFFQMPYDKKVEIVQPLALDVASGSIIIPEGIKLKSDILSEGRTQEIGGQSYTVYDLSSFNAGSSVEFTLSGTPKTGASSTGLDAIDTNTGILVGVGALGIALIAAGVILYLRDRKATEEDDEDEIDDDEAQDIDTDEIMDAIIALDDQFRSNNISQEAYEKRRDELKSQLKKNL